MQLPTTDRCNYKLIYLRCRSCAALQRVNDDHARLATVSAHDDLMTYTSQDDAMAAAVNHTKQL